MVGDWGTDGDGDDRLAVGMESEQFGLPAYGGVCLSSGLDDRLLARPLKSLPGVTTLPTSCSCYTLLGLAQQRTSPNHRAPFKFTSTQLNLAYKCTFS